MKAMKKRTPVRSRKKALTLARRERRCMSNGKRTSIEVEGFSHGANPIPAASRVGNVVMTGGINGQDPATGKVPDDQSAQVALAFANLAKIIAAAGATMESIVKLSISVKTFELRDEINVQWLKYFPDEHSRPARHVTKYDGFGGAVALQLEAYAVIL
jgi:enamine deaminase RidA (YjgF/YER057c/UK114 family)